MKEIYTLPSADAALLLMNTFPIGNANYSEAFNIMVSRSWKSTQKVALAQYYLQKMPFATAKPYEMLASFIDTNVLLSIIKSQLPSNAADRQLIAYHLQSIVKDSHCINEIFTQSNTD